MSLKIISHGVDVQSVTGPEVGDNPSVQDIGSNTKTVDVGSLGPRGGMPELTIKFSRDGGEGHVMVPINALPADRRRGWTELTSGVPGVLAYHILDPAGDSVLFLNLPSTADWMGKIPDNVSLADLTLPGTHESSAIHGMFISKCQNVDVSHQLNDGIRVLDVRVKVNDGELQTFHGIRPEHSTLRQQVDWAEDFLRAHPTETLIMSVKGEGEMAPDFSERVFKTFMEHDNGAMWRFDGKIPTLGEARGKGIIFTRFSKGESAGEWANGMGYKPDSWPDNKPEGFSLEDVCGSGQFRCHDWYGIPSFMSIGEKADSIIKHLEPTLNQSASLPFTVAFTSASTFPSAPPQWVAKGVGATSVGLGMEGVNSRITRWLVNQAAENKHPRATLMVDYYEYNGGENGLGKLMVAVNFL